MNKDNSIGTTSTSNISKNNNVINPSNIMTSVLDLACLFSNVYLSDVDTTTIQLM